MQPQLFECDVREPSRPCLATPEPSGTGPAGETCKTCEHIRHLPHGRKTFIKCGLMEKQWTHGPATDIRAGWAACAKWEGASD